MPGRNLAARDDGMRQLLGRGELKAGRNEAEAGSNEAEAGSNEATAALRWGRCWAKIRQTLRRDGNRPRRDGKSQVENGTRKGITKNG